MAKREHHNGSQAAAPKRRRTLNQAERPDTFEDNFDNEQRAYNDEIRQQDAEYGAQIKPRPNLAIREDGYRPGSLVQIYMKNVMSYDECLVNFGPKLNFVIGPNGSGKSTMLAAICLAFGAPITCMGKASLKAEQLIKASKDALEVRVVVKNFEGERDLTFKRTLARGQPNGKFYINGKDASMRAVRAKARELDIQVMSMTRFLPQDRVKDFTTMSPKELLITTMEDVGYANMRSHYDSLVHQQEHSADDEHKLKVAEDNLADLESRRETLAGQISELEEREKQEDQVRKLEGVTVYAKIQKMEARVARLREDAQASADTAKNMRAEGQKLYEKTKQYEEQVKKQAARLGEAENAGKTRWKEFRELQAKEKEILGEMAKYDGVLEAAESRLAAFDGKTAEFQAKVKEEQKKLAALNEELDDPSFKGKKEAVEAKMKVALEKVEAAKTDRKKVEMERRTLSMKADDINSKLNAEKRKNNSFQRVSRFNERLIEKVKHVAPPSEHRYSLPAINTVRLKRNNPVDQKMVSAVVRNVALHFVARDSASASQVARVEEAMTVREVTTSFEQASRNVPLSTSQLKNLGFDGYILDLVEGPDHNMAHLCEVAKIHAVPFSRAGLSPQQLSQVPPSVSKFISKDMLYTSRQSRYGNKYTSTKSESIDFPLNNSRQIIYEKEPDLTHEKELEAEYQQQTARVKELGEQLKNVDSLFKDVSYEYNEQKETLREIRSKEGKKDILAKNVQSARHKLKRHVDVPPPNIDQVKVDIEKDKAKVRDRVAATMLKRVTVATHLSDIVIKAQRYAIEHARSNVLFTTVKARSEAIKTELAELKANIDNMKVRYNQAKKEYKEYKEQHDEISPEFEEFFAALQEQYGGQEDLHAHIEAQLQALRQELTFANVDMDARAKFDEVTRQTERTREEVAILSGKRDNAAQEMQKISDVFVPELERIIDAVSSRFSLLLEKKENAAGRVNLRTIDDKLDKDGNPIDEPLPYSNWGIEIMCSFRKNSTMCKLDGTTQSGGERSMCIGTYLLSLQAVAPVAFRALDEINQALDAKNEVIMNQHVADTAAKFDQQLFLLSPKLIRFKYPPGMRILTICNGSGVTTKGLTGGSYLSLKHLQSVFG